jgi:hypothetical protein
MGVHMQRRGAAYDNRTRGLISILAVWLTTTGGTACDDAELGRPGTLENDEFEAVPSRPSPRDFGDGGGGGSVGVITPVLFVPNDQFPSGEQIDLVEAALPDVWSWYDRELGDRYLVVAPLAIVHGARPAVEYRDNNGIWDLGPGEIEGALGYSPWSHGHVVLVVGAGLVGWAGGAGNGTSGFAAIGLESLADTSKCEAEWWCTPDFWRGTAIHELGHALTLPHSVDPSIMAFHGDWTNRILLDDERAAVRATLFTAADWPPPDPGGCGDVNYQGYCDGSRVVWCENGSLHEKDCAEQGMACLWQDDAIGYNCLPAAGGCGDVDFHGDCDGGLLVWCEGGQLHEYDCGGAGLGCGWQDDAVGDNCV